MLAQELVDRMKNAMKHKVPAETVDRSAELIPGMKYRNERGGMVTVLRSSQYRVVYQREGYSGICEMSRYQFDLKFKKVRE
ncbi:DUF4222 domain-containing protein [Citrobacter freundii]|uniref:DUF4222 domain-containing protein n=1 Tax=Citrobacter freundii complex TaxID=1344959 RepID=UPI000CDBCEF4|nr:MULTISPECIES: DUF4222 domain-containing protein [Citrobacter freundii complex]EAU1439458.1 DUF4222 domain-containing protein [Salmonella enterica]EAW3939491.1 DUF4222 domain-containing protein [Salmonella enterica subsp. enterica]AUZ69058.1 hypothetical protein C2U41_06585 [Citrobacter freundii complex sp. CFNIH4]EAW4187471.1 DUF4222 domain-containing protein [Salmonella enterica subsp. enterica]EAW4265913.1 DUF4222 domain-containing protein [Salmonella enterica subsp. enterica]